MCSANEGEVGIAFGNVMFIFILSSYFPSPLPPSHLHTVRPHRAEHFTFHIRERKGVPWVRAFEFTRAKREREEGSGKLSTKFCFANHSRDHAICRPTTRCFPPVFAAWRSCRIHTCCLLHCILNPVWNNFY